MPDRYLQRTYINELMHVKLPMSVQEGNYFWFPHLPSVCLYTLIVDFTYIVQLTQPRCSLPRRSAPADDMRRGRSVADIRLVVYTN